MPQRLLLMLAAFERGEINFREKFQACTTFESNIAYTLRFMIDKRVSLAKFKSPCELMIDKSYLFVCLWSDHRNELARGPCRDVYRAAFKKSGIQMSNRTRYVVSHLPGYPYQETLLHE